MYSEIIHTIHTKRDLDVTLRELEKLKKSVYETDVITFENALSKYVRTEIAEMIRKDLSTKEVTKEEYFNVLERRMEVLEPIKLTIAIEPTELFEEKLHAWAMENISEFIYIHFVYNPKVIGGAQIEYGGKFHDYSLNKNLDELFTQQSENIIGELVKSS